MTHNCTNCGDTIKYRSKGGWLNARTKLNRTGNVWCRHCAGKIGRERSNKKPPGRPKGSKNSYKVERGPEVAKNIGWHKKEVRMKVVAKRNGYNTYEEYREDLPEWKAYQIDVWRETNKQDLTVLENYDKRGVNGQEGAYTLDHIISIRKGFNENIPPEQIGHINNLQMLPWVENIRKGWK